jgi:hypothetical protein
MPTNAPIPSDDYERSVTHGRTFTEEERRIWLAGHTAGFAACRAAAVLAINYNFGTLIEDINELKAHADAD